MSATEPDRSDEVRLAEIVMPNRTNHLGTLFGGHALGLMDHAGWVAATRFAHRTMVTVAMDRVEFKVPVHAGQLVELVARVTRVGRTSVTVGVDMYAEEIASGERRLATSGSFVFVAIDDEAHPVPIDAGDRTSSSPAPYLWHKRRDPGAWVAPLFHARRTPHRARCLRGVHLEGGWVRSVSARGGVAGMDVGRTPGYVI
jgi:acyl-CoA hydrolase